MQCGQIAKSVWQLGQLVTVQAKHYQIHKVSYIRRQRPEAVVDERQPLQSNESAEKLRQPRDPAVYKRHGVQTTHDPQRLLHLVISLTVSIALHFSGRENGWAAQIACLGQKGHG